MELTQVKYGEMKNKPPLNAEKGESIPICPSLP
jgi:hypothetical protein